MNLSNKKQSSYLSANPTLLKKLSSQPLYNPSIQISEQKECQIKNVLFKKQQQISIQLQKKLKQLTQKRKTMSQSMEYYDTTGEIQRLKSILDSLNQQNQSINQQIQHCQIVQASTTPQEYFLFKKKLRFDSFNQSIDQLYLTIAHERQQLSQFIAQAKSQIINLNQQISNLQRGLSSVAKVQNEQQYKVQHIQQSTIQIELSRGDKFSSVSQSSQLKLNQTSSQQFQSQSQVSQMSQSQLNILKQQYQQLHQTIQILSQNKQILLTQLYNNKQTIQQTLESNFQKDKTKLFRDIKQIKQDYQLMDRNKLVEVNKNQLQYSIQPLIDDYYRKMQDITNKMHHAQFVQTLLTPRRWQNINFQPYLEITDRTSITSRASVNQPQRQENLMKQYNNLQNQLNGQNESIKKKQQQLQQIMGQTMAYMQRQHQLELAMNEMRRMLQPQNDRIF